MLESAIPIPALLSAFNGWFTPAVLFVLLNLVIGTIAITSSKSASPDSPARKQLARAPSMVLDRLKSFNLSQIRHNIAGSPPSDAVVTAPDQEHHDELQSDEEQLQLQLQLERSKSEGREAVMEAKPTLPSKIKKSASDKSAFSHFEVAEMVAAAKKHEEEPVKRPQTARGMKPAVEEKHEEEEVRRPQTARAWKPAVEEDGEVDAKCDDFINRFRHQLKLQRMDSIVRYKEMIRRGADNQNQ